MNGRNRFGRWLLVALALGLAVSANAASPQDKRRERREETRAAVRTEMHVDARYQHNRSYPVRGYVYDTLPRGVLNVRYRGAPYYYRGGVWYRPYGPRFLVVAPPFGVGVAFLPPYYTTVWFGGMPYYYADDTYYLWRPERREYVVTQPPATQPETVGSSTDGSDDIFVYPRNGQSEAQQSTDRYECHSWAVEQTGFDPTRPMGGVAESERAGKRADYRRAEGACLEARGYSVK